VSVLRVAIVTCSDSCARGEATDTSGPAIAAMVRERGWDVVAYRLLPDDLDLIAGTLRVLADVESVDVVLTTGGTGLSPRDVAPEATLAACDRDVPGIAEHIRARSLEITPRAMLSRATARQRGTTLVVNLPGSEKAVRESLGFFIDQLEHAVEMMAGMGHGQRS
jgi:molybdopterin adenylyltransferase